MDHHLVQLTRQGQLAPPATFSSEGTSVFGCLSSDDQHLCNMRACLQSANLCEQRLPPKRHSFPFVYLGLSVAFVESLFVSSHWGQGVRGRRLIGEMLQDQLPVRRDFSQVNFGWAECMTEEKDERRMWLISKKMEFWACVDGFYRR